ncbi:hypothetical protein QC763_0050450 [Podospora pseudopauciseta]|uniref:Tc1-like transposase DDE domain-containing protein n=1 Tax=Podospora pseudopauciseta TaxID=2093780 RepID=A0ABR0HFY9_9PEZI|nr:hypothetical protein QC763_0050450 [Podospora pseudopauciseta]
MSYEAIRKATGASIKQIQYALTTPLTPRTDRRGRKPSQFTDEEKHRIARAFSDDPIARKLKWEDLRWYLEGFDRFKDQAFITAMRDAGYQRKVLPRRIKLTPAHMQARLAFAREQLALRPRPEDWEKVAFSDETWATNSHMWKRWLTVHEVEDIEAWASIRQKPHGWMFWAIICGAVKAGSFVWEKEYGGINSEKYQRYIVPIDYQFIMEKREQGTPVVFQHDNASSHVSNATRAYMTGLGIEQLTWPANSPDLNPIENVWFWMKNWIELNYDVEALSKTALRRAILAAWEAVPRDWLLQLAHSMPGRLQKIIDAEGKLIPY